MIKCQILGAISSSSLFVYLAHPTSQSGHVLYIRLLSFCFTLYIDKRCALFYLLKLMTQAKLICCKY